MKVINGDFKLILKNDNDDIKEISLAMVLLIDNSLETLIENSETECNSSSCNNESQNFCDCGSDYEDFEIYDIEFPDLEAENKELREMLGLALNRLENTTEYEVVDFYKEDCKKIRELLNKVK